MTKKSRRKALKGLAISVPAVWAKPVLDSVVLPAHASTTCDPSGCFAETDITGNSYSVVGGELIHYIGTETCSGEESQHSDGPISTAATRELAADELDCKLSNTRELSEHSTYPSACPNIYTCDEPA